MSKNKMTTPNYQYAEIPKPSMNGGWYTGTPFPEGAPWKSIPMTPDVSYMMTEGLRSANPPPGASQHLQGSYRPGNNAQAMPGIAPYGKTNDIMCVQHTDSLQVPPSKFARYSYY